MQEEAQQILQKAARTSGSDLEQAIDVIGIHRVTEVITNELQYKPSVRNGNEFHLEISHGNEIERTSVPRNTNSGYYPQPGTSNCYLERATDILRVLFNEPSRSSHFHLYGFLRHIHERLLPRSYLEIGVANGDSLALSRSKAIGLDPDFKITAELGCDLILHRTTSDDYFTNPDSIGHLPNDQIDFAFIDGMHNFEYALRDFINVERYSHYSSVIVIDDVLPTNVAMTARRRQTLTWTGDVFKLVSILQSYRPDLTCFTVDTWPTGVLVVLNTNPTDQTLKHYYDEIVSEYTNCDPQEVPDKILNRTHAINPTSLNMTTDIWQGAREARERKLPHKSTRRNIQQSLSRAQSNA